MNEFSNFPTPGVPRVSCHESLWHSRLNHPYHLVLGPAEGNDAGTL